MTKNKTALTAEEQAKEYLDTIQVSGEYYQSKIGNSIIHLQNIMTDFAEEFASLQTQEKDKEIAELKRAIEDEKKVCLRVMDYNSELESQLSEVTKERDKYKLAFFNTQQKF